MFVEGIKPLWEDPNNIKGGKWIIRLKKGLASRLWEDLLLAVIGGEFESQGEELCGVTCNVRFQEDILAVWNRTASDRDTTLQIKDTIRRVLSLPANSPMEYKAHDTSLKDLTSFRNTDIFA
eukprot:Colp12_sorted_trinity150504_noHs@35921